LQRGQHNLPSLRMAGGWPINPMKPVNVRSSCSRFRRRGPSILSSRADIRSGPTTGSELFYNPGPQRIGVVRINTRPTLSFGEPFVFSTAGLQSKDPANNPRVWDIAPDGKQLIGVTDATESAASGEAATQQIEVVLNWFTDLKARVPVK